MSVYILLICRAFCLRFHSWYTLRSRFIHANATKHFNFYLVHFTHCHIYTLTNTIFHLPLLFPLANVSRRRKVSMYVTFNLTPVNIYTQNITQKFPFLFVGGFKFLLDRMSFCVCESKYTNLHVVCREQMSKLLHFQVSN